MVSELPPIHLDQQHDPKAIFNLAAEKKGGEKRRSQLVRDRRQWRHHDPYRCSDSSWFYPGPASEERGGCYLDHHQHGPGKLLSDSIVIHT